MRIERARVTERETVGLLILALVFLFIGVRGLLGFAVIIPTEFSGLKRYTGRSARVAGGVYLFFALLGLFLIYTTTWK